MSFSIFSSSSPPPLLSLLSPLLRFFLGFLVLCIAFGGTTTVPTKIGKGYTLTSIEKSPNGGLLGLLQVKEKNSIYGPDIPLLQLYVKHETDNRLRVHITDATKQRWEVSYNLLPRENPPSPKQALTGNKSRKDSNVKPPSSSEYVGKDLVFAYKSDPFTFSVRRKSDGQILFDTESGGSDPYGDMVFKDQYLELSTRLPKDASLYGLGENSQPQGIKIRPNDPYTLYTMDVSAINLNTDLYGSHPVYMDLRNVGGKAYAHAVLLLNSNGMDVFYRGDSLTYKVIGGVFDLFFFSGPTPLAVVDQYTELIGRPAAMPYWAFGFHQCRWGYRNLSVVEDVVENYQNARIPLDVIWNDDDHMDGHKDFTLNPVNYPRPKLLSFLDKIHARGMKYIVIIDPGIGVNSTYGVYNRGLARDVFIKYAGRPFLAQVWPGPVNFPDFLNPTTADWWADEIRRFHALVPVDGLWIDMNEASNFCSGLCTIPEGRICPNGTGPGWVCCLDCTNITSTRWDDPPYKINASGIQAPIGYKTIATSAYHYNGVLEYDAHSLYGFSQSIATHKALRGLEGKRPFILSRSTYVGSGKYVAHWTGDNKGTWEDLRYSISTVLNFGLFGVPMVGSDICGFYPAPTEELCNRWIEVGAFYPFSRDHANFYSPRQELYQWASVAESARNALGMRYKLLPYFYTLSYEAHMTGAPIARPLFFTFTDEPELYGLSTQFLIGKSVMVSPVLEPNKTEVRALFPRGTWYDMFDMTRVVFSKETRYVMLDAPLHAINVHLYESTIVPMQRGGLISKEARMTPFTLVVAFPMGADGGKAKGNLFLDEDELPEMRLGNGRSTYVEFHAKVSDGTVKVWSEVEESEYALEKGWIVERVIVLGLSGTGAGSGVEIEVDEKAVNNGGSKVEMSAKRHEHLVELGEDEGERRSSVMVEIKGLELALGKKFSLSWKMGISG
ncbi:alpha-glucosidase [Striga asiatica]|uniref:Alpha-glucosidase n=1 Tax=Striga asiatica TaxID=4170 RepID=A0A5A7PAX5_STRAF|nr:alpha-glucosidase [Striga asiatica]